jgi:RNA polymerase-binding transcription factor DksA
MALTEEEMATLERHQPGALIEDAGREQVLAVLSRLEGLERHALEEIFTAYAKLDAGTFGTCEACGGELPLSRLRAVPAARYCLSCQTRREGVSR